LELELELVLVLAQELVLMLAHELVLMQAPVGLLGLMAWMLALVVIVIVIVVVFAFAVVLVAALGVLDELDVLVGLAVAVIEFGRVFVGIVATVIVMIGGGVEVAVDSVPVARA
jgi:hypothetical protein